MRMDLPVPLLSPPHPTHPPHPLPPSLIFHRTTTPTPHLSLTRNPAPRDTNRNLYSFAKTTPGKNYSLISARYRFFFCSPESREIFPALSATSTVSEPRFSALCDFPRGIEKRTISRQLASERILVFSPVAWETSHLTGGRKSRLTNSCLTPSGKWCPGNFAMLGQPVAPNSLMLGHPEGSERHLHAARQTLPRDNSAAQLPRKYPHRRVILKDEN